MTTTRLPLLQAGASVFGASPPADARAPNPRVRARRRQGRNLASTRVPPHRVARLVGPRATSTRESHDQSRGRDAAEEQQIPRGDPVPPHEKVARADIRGGKDDESRVRSRANTAASATATARPSPPSRRPDPTRASDPYERSEVHPASPSAASFAERTLTLSAPPPRTNQGSRHGRGGGARVRPRRHKQGGRRRADQLPAVRLRARDGRAAGSPRANPSRRFAPRRGVTGRRPVSIAACPF